MNKTENGLNILRKKFFCHSPLNRCLRTEFEDALCLMLCDKLHLFAVLRVYPALY